MVLRHKVFGVLAAATVATVAVSACSSSSGSASSSTPSGAASAGTSAAGTSTAGTSSGPAIAFGVECSCSGPFGANQMAALSVIQAWSKSVNASGGLDGHQVDLVVKDNGSNPATAVSDASSLISGKVDAIIDLDILDETWAKQASAAQIPVVGGNFSSPSYYQDPNWYPSGQTNDSITYSVAVTAKQAGATKLADFYCAESVQCQESVPLIKTAGQAVGVPVVYNTSISATAPNYTAQCLAAKQAGVTALFIGDTTNVIARVAENCTTQGYNPVYVTEGTGFTNQALTTPGLENNLWSSYPILPYFSGSSAVTAMNTALDKYAPGVMANTQTWSEFGAQAWTAGLLLAQAVKNGGVTAGGTVTAATITAGLNKVSNETLGGFSPALNFSAGKSHPVDCWYTGRVQNGKAIQVGGLTCEKG